MTNIYSINHDWNRKSWGKISFDLRGRKSIAITSLILFLDLVFLTTSIYLWTISYSMILYLISLIILSLPLTHFYLLNHEAVHGNLCKNSLINDIIGHILGWVILLPFLPRKRSHILHHIWTGHPQGDPANARMIKAFRVITKKQERKLELIWKTWIPLIVINDRKGLWLDAFDKNKDPNEYNQLSKERKFTLIYLICYIFLLITIKINNLLSLIFLLYFPALIILFIIEELINLPHHAESSLLDELDFALPYWNQHLVTHSCQNIPIWSHFIILNFNLHTAHHFYPWIPWHTLPQVHKRISELLPEVEKDKIARDNEINWSLKNRSRPLLSIMSHYFIDISNREKPQNTRTGSKN